MYYLRDRFQSKSIELKAKFRDSKALLCKKHFIRRSMSIADLALLKELYYYRSYIT